MESQARYFQQHIDEMDALGAKNPQFKMTLDAKKVEFKTEFEALKSGTGEEGARAVAALNSRVTKFMNDLVPQPANAGTQPGSKLGNTGPGAMPPVNNGVVNGGKMGGQNPGMVPPPVPGQPTGGSGFGGGAPVPVGQPTGGSGFGGTAPTPVPAQPAQPTGGSGFGGQ